MQNRYAGDIGDYIKFALLRCLAKGRRLGIAWYLYPDEAHNNDGRHVTFLEDPGRWRSLDAPLFDALAIVARGRRSVAALLGSGEIPSVAVHDEPIVVNGRGRERSDAREAWFRSNLRALEGCDLVFADPDNGLVDEAVHRRNQPVFGKQIPLSEALALAHGRTAVVYHHNTRFKGGHDKEVDHWLAQLGGNALAVRANAYSCRTFFIINPDLELGIRTAAFCADWSEHNVWLHSGAGYPGKTPDPLEGHSGRSINRKAG